MSSLLRDWDEGTSCGDAPIKLNQPYMYPSQPCFLPSPQGSKGRRKKLLEWFRDRFAPFSSSHGNEACELLESECGADTSFFLTRVLVWMHKTVANSKCFALSEQLACVQIFLTSANVHVYYREFQQADGLALLIKVLGIQNPQGSAAAVRVSDANRVAIMELLLGISQRGRMHKEEISRCNGEIAIIRGALAGIEKCGGDGMAMMPLWDACRDALLEQMVGNPQSVEQVHATIVFMLQYSEVKELQVFGAQVCTRLGKYG